MKFTPRIPVTAAMLALLLGSATGCEKLKSRDQLVKGVQAFKNARYEDAVDHFQNAIRLDPSSSDAKLYLATAYSYQVVPNLDTPENLKTAQNAINGFQEVLAKDPNDLTALKQIASIDRNIKKLDEAKDYEKKVIAIAPGDAEAHYTIGVVDWMQAYKNAITILAADGKTDDGNGNVKMSKGACQKIKDANAPLVQDGLNYLHKAVDINKSYEEAMTYLNLMYRRQADLDCGNGDAVKQDLAQADDWTQKAMGARKENELKKEQKGLSEGERVVDTFVAPSKTFTDILRSASWWLPFVLLAVVTLATAFVIDRQVGFERVAENQVHLSPAQSDRIDALPADQKAAQLHGMSKGYRYSTYGSFVLILIFVAIFALVYWASFNFGLGAQTTYGQMFAVWMYASLPKLFVGLLTIGTLLAGANAEGYNLQNPVGTNPAYYMPDAAPWLRSALSFLDVFSLWQLALLILGTAIVAKVTQAKAAAVVLGSWMLGLIVSAGLAAAFS